MRILIIADPLDEFKTYKDSTFAMMTEAAARGHALSACLQQDLLLSSGRVHVCARPVTLTPGASSWYAAGDAVRESAAAFDAVPLSRSPVFAGYFDYALPLAFEVARHPRLDDVLAEIERNIPTQLDPGHPLRVGMKALIGRIRAREATRRAAEAKARRGFFGRLFDRD